MVIWREYKGHKFPCPAFVPHGDGELFLRQILAMPRDGKTPINYDEANLIFGRAYRKWSEANTHDLDTWIANPRLKQQEIQASKNFLNQMIAWLTVNGYWLQLDGTEYTSSAQIQ